MQNLTVTNLINMPIGRFALVVLMEYANQTHMNGQEMVEITE